jgi:NADH-quinone oxidoreductase subunit L
MFLALGVGAFDAAIFHLMTHAFFKALLFLGAGSVIHGMGGEQDIRKMGGLRHRMPVTFVTFFIAALAISGIPGLSGFFSKDEILFSAFNGSVVLWSLGAFGAGLTAFYMFRLVILTFFGECRATAEVQHHMHESPTSMTLPLMVLAGLSIVGGYVGLPNGFLWGHVLGHFLEPSLAIHHVEHHSVALEITLMCVSVAIALIGIAVAYTLYIARPGLPEDLAARFRAAHRLLLDKYNVDELYDAAFVRTTVSLSNWLWQVFDVRVVDGIVNGTASRVAGSSRSWRRLQTGDVQHYALSFLFGALLIVGYFALR